MDKGQLRRRFRGVPVSTSDDIAVTEALFHFLSARLPGTISAYRAMGDEVDIFGLVERLPGWQWVLPRVEPDDSLTWRDARVDLESHRWGMEQPEPIGDPIRNSRIDVFLVPGLAFDRTGARLGRGRGFFDSELAVRRADSLAVGVTIEERVLTKLPVEGHDQPMTHLATQSGVIEAIPTS